MIKNKESLIGFRVTEATKKKLTKEGAKKGKRLSEYLREIIEKHADSVKE